MSSKTERFYGIDSAAEQEHGAQDWLTAMARVIAAVRRMMARRAGKNSSHPHVKNNNKQISASSV
ncbi:MULTISPECIES: hypothetical protein [Janthinobacterium]|uniref:hypothetical protein n=1 Tax=Janthinobacterium TaxID=29580 RepID=UPI001269E386|nr:MULTISPECIES: hypothetical protein [unclassified Janthinobacterium]NVI82071.1 hypothetical protein [Janthinobacterium sp. BJB401]